jgi:sugar phosphate isomerase/epimerase
MTAPDLARFSFNQATAQGWPMADLVAGCVAHGVPGVGLWRAEVAEFGLGATAALARDAGLQVTSLCRGGFFPASGWFDENRRAIDEAAALGAPVLVLVSGGLPDGSRDIDAARAHVGAAIGKLVPHALDAGVRLAIEPLHPMFASDRCVVSTLDQALDLAAPYPAEAVGVVVDTYHVWWDDRVWAGIARAGEQGRLACFQVADWVTPLPAGVLLGRALPGAGCVDMARFTAAVAAAGYTGPIEVEVFHEELWSRPGPEILAATIDAYRRHVAGGPGVGTAAGGPGVGTAAGGPGVGTAAGGPGVGTAAGGRA